MRKTRLAIILLALVILITAYSISAVADEETVRIPMAETPITVDGTVSWAEWGAPTKSFPQWSWDDAGDGCVIKWNEGSTEDDDFAARFGTTFDAWFKWDGDYLYFALTSSSIDPGNSMTAAEVMEWYSNYQYQSQGAATLAVTTYDAMQSNPAGVQENVTKGTDLYFSLLNNGDKAVTSKYIKDNFLWNHWELFMGSDNYAISYVDGLLTYEARIPWGMITDSSMTAGSKIATSVAVQWPSKSGYIGNQFTWGTLAADVGNYLNFKDGMVVCTLSDEVTVTGNVEWDDSERQGQIPDSVRLQLFADGVAVGEPKSCTAENGWKVSWENMHALNSTGKTIYTVQIVDELENVQISYSDGAPTAKVKLLKELVKVSSQVQWEDGASQRPHEITLQLYANGTACGDPVKVNGASGWQYTWTGLDKLDAEDQPIAYTVKQTVPEGYKQFSNADGSLILNVGSIQKFEIPKAGNVTIDGKVGSGEWGEPTEKYTAYKGWDSDTDEYEIWMNDGIMENCGGAFDAWFRWDGEYLYFAMTSDTVLPGNELTTEALASWWENNDYWMKGGNWLGVVMYEDWMRNNTDALAGGTNFFFTLLDNGEKTYVAQIEKGQWNAWDAYHQVIADEDYAITYTEGKLSYEVRIPWSAISDRTDIGAGDYICTALAVQCAQTAEGVCGNRLIWGSGSTNTNFKEGYIVAKLVDAQQQADTRTTEFTLTVLWDDGDAKRPDQIELQLYADGKAVGNPVKFSAHEGSCTWKDLPKYNGDNLIVYSAKQVTAPKGYHVVTSTDGKTVFNLGNGLSTYKIGYANGIAIDGVLSSSEWGAATEHFTAYKGWDSETDEYEIWMNDGVVENCGGTFDAWFKWDEGYLYFAMTSDTVLPGNELTVEALASWWENNDYWMKGGNWLGVVMYEDWMRNNTDALAGGTNFFFTLLNNGQKAYVTQIEKGQWNAYEAAHQILSGDDYAITYTGGKLTYEVRIPWSAITDRTDIKAGDYVCTSLMVQCAQTANGVCGNRLIWGTGASNTNFKEGYIVGELLSEEESANLSPNTGDSMNLLMLCAVMLLSLSAAACMVVIGKRKQMF